MNDYDAVWWNEFLDPPAFVWLDLISGDTPEQALLKNIKRLTKTVRELYGLYNSPSDKTIQRTLYAIRSKGLVCADDLVQKERNAKSPRPHRCASKIVR